MCFANTRIFGVKRIFHTITPKTLKVRPIIGARGIKGQRIIKIRLKRLPIIMMMRPAKSRIRREKKPMMREIRRSKNAWNLISKEASELADSAEI